MEKEKGREFTIQELSIFNGKDGKPAYAAYKGKVYDVTDSSQWTGGDHLGHAAGEDLTEAMEIAPHADDVMERMKAVGVLIKP
jgi:predicted heme/steroid binding protein